jgi:hypothetical protein
MLAAAETQLQVLQPLVPVNVYALVAFCLPLLNLALRVVTQQAVTVGGTVDGSVDGTAAEPKP